MISTVKNAKIKSRIVENIDEVAELILAMNRQASAAYAANLKGDKTAGALLSDPGISSFWDFEEFFEGWID